MKNSLIKFYLKTLKKLDLKTVHFIHIGKTGGSVIRNSFSESSVLVGNYLLSYPYIFHMHGHTFKFNECGSNELAFFVVRDPVSRFVSGFYSRMREGKPKNYNPWSPGEAAAFATFESPNQLAEALGSEDPQIRGEAQKAMGAIGHVNSFYWDWFINEEYLRANRSKIMYVMEQQTLTDDFRDFKNKFSVKVKSLSSDPVKSHKNSDTFNRNLSPAAVANIKEWYTKDYEFLHLLKELGLIKQTYIK